MLRDFGFVTVDRPDGRAARRADRPAGGARARRARRARAAAGAARRARRRAGRAGAGGVSGRRTARLRRGARRGSAAAARPDLGSGTAGRSRRGRHASRLPGSCWRRLLRVLLVLVTLNTLRTEGLGSSGPARGHADPAVRRAARALERVEGDVNVARKPARAPPARTPPAQVRGAGVLNVCAAVGARPVVLAFFADGAAALRAPSSTRSTARCARTRRSRFARSRSAATATTCARSCAPRLGLPGRPRTATAAWQTSTAWRSARR